MSVMNPQLLWLLLVLPVIFGTWLLWGRRAQTLKNTQMDRRVGVSSRYGTVVTALIWVCKGTAWTALVLAAASTSFPVREMVADSKGSVYFALDTSSSMVWGLKDPNEVKMAALYNPKWQGWKYEAPTGSSPWDPANKPQAEVPIRIEAAFGAIKDFGEREKNLGIGLVAADDQVFWLYPSTKSHDLVVDMLPQIYQYIVGHSTGDNFCGPDGNETHTGLGPAAISMFEHEPNDAPHILAFFSDGDFDCSPAREAYLKTEFARLHIQLVVFGVGDDWATDSGEVPAFKEFLKLVGGDLVQLQDVQGYAKGLEHLKAISSASVHKVRTDHHKDALLLLLCIAGVAFALALGLSALRNSNL